MDEQRWDNQLEPTYHSSVLIQGVSRKTSQEQWTIETGDERGSGRSVLALRHDDSSQWITFSTWLCLVFYSFWVSLLHSHNMWLSVLSLFYTLIRLELTFYLSRWYLFKCSYKNVLGFWKFRSNLISNHYYYVSLSLNAIFVVIVFRLVVWRAYLFISVFWWSIDNYYHIFYLWIFIYLFIFWILNHFRHHSVTVWNIMD